MEIKFPDNHKLFGEIPIGMVFVTKGHVYIKIEEIDGNYAEADGYGYINAIAFPYPKFHCFSNDTIVEICPNAKLSLTGY